jgi:hypothetical protein
MAYTGSGQLIQATDFNGLASTTTGGNIAWVWGTGWQRTGYGQSTTLLSSVSATSIVTATQWAGLVYTVNNALAHQGQATIGGGPTGANINMTAGQTITYFANVATAVTQVNTTRNSYFAVGTTTTGSNFTASISFPDSATAYGFATSRTVTFASAAQARYFFNAGGRLQLVLTASNNNATARSGDFVSLFQTWLGGSIIYDANSAARTGTGGTLNSSNTAAGYYTLTTTPTILANVSSNSATYTYNSDWARIQVNSNGVQGTTGDQGTVITFTMGCGVAAQTNSNFNDAVNVTLTSRVDVIFPETTYLANSWGAITIA